ncbi:MAG: hypothetical protein IJ946_04415 [Clostridia bacterium]|nr:hypothetical protein [Clostridia bacterium]
MAWFKRKKKDKYDDIDPSILTEDDFYIGAKKAGEKVLKAHSLTADEIENDDSNVFFITDENPLESLRKRVKDRTKDKEDDVENASDDENTASFFIDSSFLDQEASNEPAGDIPMVNDAEAKAEKDATELAGERSKETEEEEKIEEIKEVIPEEVITETQAEEAEHETQVQEKAEESLLQTCLPFIMDGNNGEYSPTDNKPAYTLDSVASILGIEEKEEESKETKEKISEEEKAEEEITEATEKTMVFKKIDDTDRLPDISDIDNNTKVIEKAVISSTATMPVIIPDEMISATRDVTVPDEIKQAKALSNLGISEEQVLEEYEAYTPEFEFKGKGDRKKIKRRLLSERRSRFLRLIGSVTGLIILGIFALPAFSDIMLTFNTTVAVFTAIGHLLCVGCNYDVIFSLTTVFTKRASAESGIALTAILSTVTIMLSFINTLAGEIYYGIALMNAVSLVFRAYFRFRRSQYIYTNFLHISNDKDKYGITLIDDAPTTFAMARKAIDGEVLIAAHRRTKNVTNFIKNSTFDVDLDGRARLFFIIGAAFSLLAGVAFGLYRSNFMTGMVTVCAFTALFAPLTSIACSVLPISSAAAHLNRYGSVLTGLTAANQIEAANACVIDCDTLFPKGSIKLANMKVLSPNNLESTIACACAITTNAKSPLAPIFKKIMESNKDIAVPEADSIKYEERLGLTGWVGNKRIFIGNRALMLAHEIPVPDAEKDKKLMREGYFPVYVATGGKACALIVLKYVPDPDIAKELDRISAMGLTILVNNCDQNISEEMVCDYFDLYSDSVKVMSGSGVHMYRTATTFEESMNAGAVIKRSAAAMAATVYCANRVKKANSLLQVAHIVSIVLGVILFSYIVFGNAYVNCVYVALYQLACFILSGVAYLFTKP